MNPLPSLLSSYVIARRPLRSLIEARMTLARFRARTICPGSQPDNRAAMESGALSTENPYDASLLFGGGQAVNQVLALFGRGTAMRLFDTLE
jgi:hypothetical protein